MTIEGPLHSPPLLSPLSPLPHAFCVICRGPFMRVAIAWTGRGSLRWRLAASLTSLLCFWQQWRQDASGSSPWMLVILSLKEKNLGRAWGWISWLGFSLFAEVWCSRCRVRDDRLGVVWEEMQNCNMTPGLGIKWESGRGSTKRLMQSKHKPKTNFKFLKQIIQETLRSRPLYHFKWIVCVWSLSPLLLFK